MSQTLFWLFSTIMLIGACAVIAFRNPVSSAMAMVTSFVGLAALFIGLSAFFVGMIQETKRATNGAPLFAGLALVVVFFIQFIGVLGHKLPNQSAPELNKETLAAAATQFPADGKITGALNNGKLPDVHLIGHTLFTEYNLPLQILGVLLLVATVGVVVLSKKSSASENTPS